MFILIKEEEYLTLGNMDKMINEFLNQRDPKIVN